MLRPPMRIRKHKSTVTGSVGTVHCAGSQSLKVELLCLSTLMEGEASGYEIAKRFSEGKGSLYAEASLGAIYPTLARLETKEFVTVETILEVGKPSRKVYSITNAGAEHFISALKDLDVEDRYTSPFMLFMSFSDLLPVEVVAAKIKDRRAHLERERQKLANVRCDENLSSLTRGVVDQRDAVMAALIWSLPTIATGE